MPQLLPVKVAVSVSRKLTFSEGKKLLHNEAVINHAQLYWDLEQNLWQCSHRGTSVHWTVGVRTRLSAAVNALTLCTPGYLPSCAPSSLCGELFSHISSTVPPITLQPALPSQNRGGSEISHPEFINLTADFTGRDFQAGHCLVRRWHWVSWVTEWVEISVFLWIMGIVFVYSSSQEAASVQGSSLFCFLMLF